MKDAPTECVDRVDRSRLEQRGGMQRSLPHHVRRRDVAVVTVPMNFDPSRDSLVEPSVKLFVFNCERPVEQEVLGVGGIERAMVIAPSKQTLQSSHRVLVEEREPAWLGLTEYLKLQ